MRRRAAFQLPHESLGGAFGIPELRPPIRRQNIKVITKRRQNMPADMKAIIAQAFKELAQQKSIDKITVKSLI